MKLLKGVTSKLSPAEMSLSELIAVAEQVGTSWDLGMPCYNKGKYRACVHAKSGKTDLLCYGGGKTPEAAMSEALREVHEIVGARAS